MLELVKKGRVIVLIQQISDKIFLFIHLQIFLIMITRSGQHYPDVNKTCCFILQNY